MNFGETGQVAFVVPMFGEWPSWSTLFFQSCARNPGVVVILICENAPLTAVPKNVSVIKVTRDQMRRRFETVTGLSLPELTGHKLCDFRPFFGLAFSDVLTDFNFWGYCDTDMMFGDLTKLLTSDFLDSMDVFSAHDQQLVGHFSIVRNTKMLNQLCFRINGWAERCRAVTNQMMDEKVYAQALSSVPSLRWQRPENLNTELGKAFCRFGITFDFEGNIAYLQSEDIPIVRWRDGLAYYVSQSGKETEVLYVHFMGLKRCWHWIFRSAGFCNRQEHVFSRIGYCAVGSPAQLLAVPWQQWFWIQRLLGGTKRQAGLVLRKLLPNSKFLKVRRLVFGRGRY